MSANDEHPEHDHGGTRDAVVSVAAVLAYFLGVCVLGNMAAVPGELTSACVWAIPLGVAVGFGMSGLRSHSAAGLTMAWLGMIAGVLLCLYTLLMAGAILLSCE